MKESLKKKGIAAKLTVIAANKISQSVRFFQENVSHQ